MGTRYFDDERNELHLTPRGPMEHIGSIGGELDEGVVALRASGRRLNKEASLSKIGIAPTFAWNPDEPHSFRGITQVIRTGVWQFEPPNTDDVPAAQIARIFAVGSPEPRDWLEAFGGLDAHLWIKATLRRWNAETTLPPHLLQAAAERGLSIRLDVVYDGESDDG